MKFITLLPLAALASAFVLPDDGLTNQILTNTQDRAREWLEKLPGADEMASLVRESYETGVAFSENAIDNAIVASIHAEKAVSGYMCPHSMTAFDVQSWLDSANNPLEGEIDFSEEPKHPHHPPHKKPHKRPHHRRPHGNPNLTVYELIAKSKYTTKLAKLINEYDDLVSLLNSTVANFTIFAPTDKAFEKLPDHGKKPSKDLIKKVLLYHISTDFYPARRILASHTIPSDLELESLGGRHQRLRVGLSLKGLSINHFSKVVAVNIVSLPSVNS